jgi:hypothetical protein
MTKTAAAEAVTTHWTAYTALICDSLKQLTLEQQNIMNALGVSTTKNTTQFTGNQLVSAAVGCGCGLGILVLLTIITPL